MKKKILLERINNQEKQIDNQRKTSENIMEIFKILAEGGDIAVHIYSNKEPSYFVTPKDSNKSNFELCTRKIFEGLYARGLLILTNENVHEDFAVQRYALRIVK